MNETRSATVVPSFAAPKVHQMSIGKDIMCVDELQDVAVESLQRLRLENVLDDDRVERVFGANLPQEPVEVRIVEFVDAT